MSLRTTSNLAPGRRHWELLRCSNATCEHEAAPRAVGDRLLTLPCQVCRSEMLVLPLAVIGEARPADRLDPLEMLSALQAAIRQGKANAGKRGNPVEVARYEGLTDAYTEAAAMLVATGVGHEGER